MIYKYKGLRKENLNQHLEICQELKLFFCMGKLLNDPFEGQIIGDKKIQNIFQNAGICSFSRVEDNLLMWSHYANSHNGICYGFDKRLLAESLWKNVNAKGETFFEEGDVLYTSSPPHVYDKGFGKYEAKDIIFNKSLGWSYEQEYRIAVATPRSIQFELTSLKKVIIGSHVPIWHEEYDKLWEAIAALNSKGVDVIVNALNDSSYGVKSVEAYSHGGFGKKYEEKKLERKMRPTF